MTQLRWGILSAGLISFDFAVSVVSALPESEHELHAVAARSLESAQEFAKTFGIPKAYGSYEELVQDPEVDVVYIGSINTQHLPLAKLALNNGKPVLCEKPLAINVKEVKEILELTRSKNLFFMEAIWSRFFPAYRELSKQIEAGSLGDILQVLVTFGEPIDNVDRLRLKELGGGTMLDLGVYCVQFADLVFGEKPDKIISGGHLNDDGVDESTSTTLVYSRGRTATLLTHSKVSLPNEALVIGTKKTLKVKAPFWCSTELEEVGGKTMTFPLPPEKLPTKFENGVGMYYEAIEVRNRILQGAIESPIMSHEKSLLIAEIMESARKQIGVVYPQD